MRFVPWIVVLLIGSSAPALAQIGADGGNPGQDDRGDPRVREALDTTGMVYQVDGDDDFKLVISVAEERTQLVWVRSTTHNISGLEIREVWSPVYADDSGSVPDEIASWALQRSWRLVAGSLTSPGEGAVYYVIKVDANASPDVLEKLVQIAAMIGDELEQEKSEGDKL